MSAERAIYSILSTTGAITQVVGDRIYPKKIEQGVDLPAITYQQISGPRVYNVSGPIGWVPSRHQITAWATNNLQAADLAAAIIVAFGGLSGTVASLEIDHIFVEDEGDIESLSAENTELDVYGKRVDIQMVFKE